MIRFYLFVCISYLFVSCESNNYRKSEFTVIALDAVLNKLKDQKPYIITDELQKETSLSLDHDTIFFIKMNVEFDNLSYRLIASDEAISAEKVSNNFFRCRSKNIMKDNEDVNFTVILDCDDGYRLKDKDVNGNVVFRNEFAPFKIIIDR